MGKKFLSTRVEEHLYEDFRAIAKRKRWSIQTTMEVALEQFISWHNSMLAHNEPNGNEYKK